MRPVTVLGSTLAVLMLVNACATTSSSTTSSRYGSTQPAPRAVGASYGSLGDSIIAQAIADREGPRVSIRAQLTNFADSRRVRGVFRLDDDAYVVVGHIDADGVLRIAFPNDPTDDGFVRGDRTYQTSEFFAGFNSEYRFRARTSMFHYSAASSYAYDGGLGYVFVIASWRPMRFDRFRTGNDWDSFDLADANYMRDPRPAIYELATLLAGDNREAYTVKFARFTDTQTIYGGYGTLASAYSAGYCAGYEPFGFASSPFGSFGSRMFDPYGYGGNFRYRGTNYYYDAGGDCYRSGTFGSPYYGYGYRVVQTPVVTTPTRRALSFDGNRPTPTPQALPGHIMPTSPVNAPTDEGALNSPQYRQRGLISEEASSTGPVRRQPRVEGSTMGQDQAQRRPSLQDMVNRRGENRNDGSLIERSRMGQDNNYDARRQGGSQPTPRERVQADNSGEPRGYSRPQQRDGGRSEPRSEPSTPRFQAPERTAPPARSEPSPRMQAPERTAPPPARAEPRSEPARAPERPANPPASAASKPDTPPVKPPTR